MKAINCTKIRYINVLNKLYEVEKISFFDFSVSARETNKTIADVPEEEIFNLSDLNGFKVKLNNNWTGTVIDFAEYVKNRKSQL